MLSCCSPDDFPGDDPEHDVLPPPRKDKHYRMLATDDKDILYSQSGNLSESNCPGETVGQWLQQAVEIVGESKMVAAEKPVPPPESKGVAPSLPLDQWTTWSVAEFYQDSRQAAKAFIELGLGQFSCISIFGFNAPEWFISASGAILAGAKYNGIYLTDTPAITKYKIGHSSSAIAAVDEEQKYDSVVQNIGELPELKAVIVWGMERTREFLTRSDGSMVQVQTFTEILTRGKENSDAALDARVAATKPSQAVGLIYTSGTTGFPKAAMVSHDNFRCALISVGGAMAETCRAGPGAILSYLPLSHVAGMGLDMFCPLYARAKWGVEFCTYCARPYDMKEATLVARMKTVQPTLFFGVPRVFEKMQAKIKEAGAANTGVKKALVTWAKEQGSEHCKSHQYGGSRSVPFMHGLADALVLQKARDAIGWSNCKAFLTGAAPITTDTLEFFGALGVEILNLYGMTESSGLMTTNFRQRNLFGTVGEQISGVDVKCFRIEDGKKIEAERCEPGAIPTEAQQGEICCRGRAVMMGYMANPRFGKDHMQEIERKNAETIDDEGWLHSGDKGCLDFNGFLRITGRYKELIIGAGGENIAPVPVEEALKQKCPALSNVIMVGNNRPYNIMLVTLQAEGATGELPGNDNLAGFALRVNAEITTVTEAMNDPVWGAYIEDGLDSINEDAQVCQSNAWKIQKVGILPRDFSVSTGEFTSTLKLKRSVVEDKWADAINEIYKAKGRNISIQHLLHSQTT